MKTLRYISANLMAAVMMLGGTACSQWLEVYPQNDQVSDYYWSSKEDVEAMINGAYYEYREMVVPQLIPLGELRAGHLFSRGANANLQEFRVKETDAICNWGPFYEVINVANGVLSNARKVLAVDETYDENMLNSHKAEAYFLRALSYFYLVRNWREVPLILEPYETDAQEYHIGQSSEESVIARIKEDLKAALASGAAKEYYNKTWENKGRATKWAICALMADVCLWNGDYGECEQYCDMILNSGSTYAPSFLASPSHASWFSMFNPGNSNESIFELQWNEEDDESNTLPILFDNSASGRVYAYSERMTQLFVDECQTVDMNYGENVRSMYGGFYTGGSAAAYLAATTGYCWKYLGSQILSEKRTADFYDPNFIIYRVAEVILMKAEALVMQGPERYSEAIALIDRVHSRSNLGSTGLTASGTNEVELLTTLLNERATEFAGEAKAWYDMLRVGRRDGYKYKDIFITARLLEFNKQASTSWFRAVLSDNNSLYLPVYDKELDVNPLLHQNPFYE